jgi:tRNA-2-methylthio-N6-dimethylallyladenosine synthase
VSGGATPAVEGPAPSPVPSPVEGESPAVHFVNFGCQMNELDAELVLGDLARKGWRRTDDAAAADVILVNTCSVREHAEDRVWSLLGTYRPLKKVRPSLRIGVLGCMAQRVKGEVARRAPHVDLVLGTSNFRSAVEDLEDLRRRGGRIVRTDRRPDPEHLPDADREVSVRAEPHRAYVTVMRGCDHVCAYCIVPFTRGRETSRPMDDVLSETRRLAEDGVREVTFLGQNINTYGKDRPSEGGLCALLERAAGIEGVARLRFLTSNPFDMTEDMMRRFGAVPKVMPWLHIPAQSGSDAVLARMKRTYTAAQYREVVSWARRHVPGVEITSDFIVGFPGETDADFEATLALVEEIGFVQAYVFKYSVRPNTLAARRMDDDVPEDVKRDRNLRLLAAQDRASDAANRALVGSRVEVLVDGPSKTDPARGTGRTPGNRLVHVAGAQGFAGRLVVARVTSATAHSLQGEALAAEPAGGPRWRSL